MPPTGVGVWCTILRMVRRSLSSSASPRIVRAIVRAFPLAASVWLVACPSRAPDPSSPTGVAVQPMPPGSPPSTSPGSIDGAFATPGMVACGDQNCDLTTSYCQAANGETHKEASCRPKGPDFDPERLDPYTLQCDDVSDCAPGTVCCAQWGGGGDLWFQCAPPPCSATELCTNGSKCSAGLKCVQDGMVGTGFSCQSAAPGAPCGPTRCAGERPICCWNAEQRTGSCVASDAECPSDPSGNRIPFRCGSKADCGGYFCLAQWFSGSRCVGGGLFNEAMCDTFADCPERDVQSWELYTHCVKDQDGFGRCSSGPPQP